jgi:signal transduction histidine kinase
MPAPEPVDLERWLPDQIGRWADHARASELRVESRPAGSTLVLIQPALLGQLVDNLIENALEYSPPGSLVVVRVRAANGMATLEVEDAGPGIAPEHLDHVFEPFYRVCRANGSGQAGVGLGLAVVQRIAAVLGGTMTVVSEVGRDSRFRLDLPVCQTETLPQGGSSCVK